MKLIDKILEDFSALDEVIATEVDDFQNPIHILKLKEIMASYGIQYEVINPIIRTLTEEDDEGGLDDDEKEKAEKMGLTHLGRGSYGKEGKPPTHKAQDGKLVKVDIGKEPEKDGSGKLKPDDFNPEKTGYLGIGKDDSDDTEQHKDSSIEANTEVNKELQDKISKEKNPKKKEALKAEYISNQLGNMLRVSSIESGAGRYDISREDVITYRKYLEKIMNDPDGEPAKTLNAIKEERKRKYGEVTEDDIDSFIADLEVSSKSGSKKSDMYDPTVVIDIKSKIRGKGNPGSTYTTGNLGEVRYRNVIRAYLETGGISPITGEVVPFSECQLDHIVSLGNGGKDEPDNWMFMEERFNQYKGKKTDEDIRSDLERDFYLTDAEIAAGEESAEVTKALKAEDRAFWKSKFNKVKGSDNPREIGVTINQLNKMSKTELGNFIYGWNLANPDDEISRYGTQKIEVGGKSLEYARGEGEDNPVKPVKGDPSTYGLVVNDDGEVVKKYPNDKEADSIKRFKDNRASGGREKGKSQFVDLIVDKGLASDSTKLDEIFADEVLNHRTGQNKRNKVIKAKVKAAEKAPGSMENKKKIVEKSLKDWDNNNIEPGGKNDEKFIKDAMKRKKSQDWQDWKKKRDIFEYQQWSKFADKEKTK